MAATLGGGGSGSSVGFSENPHIHQGDIRSKIVRSDLVYVAIKMSNAITRAQGTGSSVQQQYASASSTFSNADRSGFAVNLTTGILASNNQVEASFGYQIWGPTVAIRIRRDTNAPFSIGVMVDGQAKTFYPRFGIDPYTGLSIPTFNSFGTNNQDFFSYIIFADDLLPVLHNIIVTTTPSTAATQTLTLYGFGADRSAGYPTLETTQSWIAPQACPTSQTSIPYERGQIDEMRGIRGIYYVDTTGGSQKTITVVNSSTMRTFDIPLGKDYYWDLGKPTAINTNWTHACNLSGVNFTVIGEL